MIYEWKDRNTGKIVEVQRSIADRDVPPEDDGDWVRIISKTTTPFEHLRDKGVFDRTHFKRGT